MLSLQHIWLSHLCSVVSRLPWMVAACKTLTLLFTAEDEVMEDAPISKAPTAQQITAIKAAIQNAQTLKEVEELEKALVTGHVPSAFKVSCQN